MTGIPTPEDRECFREAQSIVATHEAGAIHEPLLLRWAESIIRMYNTLGRQSVLISELRSGRPKFPTELGKVKDD